jgi:hypothetical protein
MRVTLLLAMLVGAFVAGCSDNSLSIVDRIAEGASRLRSGESGASTTVSWDPTNGSSAPYTVIVFPNHDVAEGDLVAAGVDRANARRIYSELAYLDSLAGMLLVDQEGERLNFTSSWKQIAEVHPPETLVVSQRKTGTAEIELRREGGTIRVRAIR